MGSWECECVCGVIVYRCVCEGSCTGVDGKWLYAEVGRVEVELCAREEMCGRRVEG